MNRCAAVVIGLVLAACAQPGTDTSTQAASPTATAPSASEATTARAAVTAEAVPTGVGVPAALDWAEPGVGGGEVDGRALAGGDVALWFWAPW